MTDDTKNISKVAFAPDGKLLATAEVGLVLGDNADFPEAHNSPCMSAESRRITSFLLG